MGLAAELFVGVWIALYIDMKVSFFCLIIFTFLTGCLPQNAPESLSAAKDVRDGVEDGIGIKPAFHCGEGKVIVGVNPDGSVVCDSAAPKGLAPQIDQGVLNDCGQGEQIETLSLSQPSGGWVTLSTCVWTQEQTTDDVTLGESPARTFECPFGSALKGFSDVGEPICGMIFPSSWDGISFVVENEKCPFGFSAGSLVYGNFILPTCAFDKKSPSEKVLYGQRVTKKNWLNNQICSGKKIAVGFDEDHNIICASIGSRLDVLPSSYYATQFSGGKINQPVCKGQYQATEVNIERWNGTQILSDKIWVCSL